VLFRSGQYARLERDQKTMIPGAKDGAWMVPYGPGAEAAGLTPGKPVWIYLDVMHWQF